MALKDPVQESGAVLGVAQTQTERLTAVVGELADGRGSVLEITGEPGIGKTTLLGQLAERAARAGALVARAHAAHGSAPPGQVVEDVWDALDARDAPTARALGPETDAELRDVLTRWAARHGGVLVLDNVHLYDDQSARLMARLVRTPPPGPFVLALAHRPRQSRPVLREALDHGAETGSVIRLAPAPLDLRAISAHLGRGRSGRSHADAVSPSARDHAYTQWRDSTAPVIDGTYTEQLHAACGGNPRMLRILVAAKWDPDEWPLSAGPDQDGMLREATSVITELDALTADAARSAQAAAVLGDPFLWDDVAAVSGLGPERTVAAFTELVEADLIRALPRGGGYVFRHPVLGHVTLAHASPALRANSHGQALELLTTRGAPALRRARQAEYLVGAGSSEARQVLVEGAAEAMAHSPAVAARWLRLALDSLPAGDRISAPRVVLVLDCCRALSAVGRLQEARSLVHDLLRYRSDLSEELRQSAYAVCGELERLLGRHQEAEAVVRTELDLVPRPLPVPLPASVAELVTAYGRVQLFRGAYGEARDVVREAAEAAGDADPTVPYLRALGALGDTQLGLLPEAVAEVTECARIVDALPDAAAVTLPDVLAMLGCAELFQERFHDSYRHLERGLQATTGATRRLIRVNQLVALCHLDQMTGRLESLCHRAAEAELLARMSGADEAAGIAMTLRATGLLWTRPRRDTEKLLELAEEGFSLASRKRGWRAAVAVGLRACAQFLGGDPAGCLRTLVEQGGPRLQRLLPVWQPSLLALACEAALRCGDIDAARGWAVAGETVAEQLGLPVQHQYVRRARAALLAAEGEHGLAARLFHESAESFRREGLPVEHAWTLVTGAPSVCATHGPQRALDWLDTAGRVARARGAQRIHDEAAKVRALLPPATPTTTADAEVATVEGLGGWTASATLTEREREIAKLAAEGRRTKDIAERLFISTRTVESHLGRIYRKLDISSRAALARALDREPRQPTV
ncbi:LuxR C-terminal-related transcriptional regulator [Streptomyces sp. SID13726]|uniref:helix-turn-helix transcriptional regulator n=1 Tax=Streptomyces sp. SID13726 TaxID=2706058 RepID=UPI0013B67EB2|nr:LuxR C-terminal-related transcriptional regulator [Streptomyces sp. SID13726]NEA99596.1 AAA family ATPase [Streptomyces sp. SID13726]